MSNADLLVKKVHQYQGAVRIARAKGGSKYRVERWNGNQWLGAQIHTSTARAAAKRLMHRENDQVDIWTDAQFDNFAKQHNIVGYK